MIGITSVHADNIDVAEMSPSPNIVAEMSPSPNNIADFINAAVIDFQNNRFIEALENFHLAEQMGLSNPDLYFNIGNTYFRLGNLPYAIIYYKKVLLLNSSHKGATNNLEFALSLTRDRQVDGEENFVSNFVINTVYLFSINTLLVLILILLAIIIIIIHIQWRFPYMDRTVWRFVNFMLLFILLGVSGLTISRISLVNNNKDAVVVQSIVNVYSGPSESFTRLFTIHEGTVLRIQREENGWSQVSTMSGFSGWIESESFRKIQE